MNLFTLSWQYIKGKPLNTLLNTLLLGFGIAIIVVLLLMSHQVKENLTKNANGIDLVVGAKGSPLQLILSSIFHIDFPTGNIPLDEARKVSKNRMVKRTIPLALGDSYQGLRIVGTNHGYAELYQGQLADGKWWEEDLEATLGAVAAQTLGLQVGDEFIGEHGLGSGGHQHDEHAYTVVGVMQKTGSVIDQLILTNVESVWVMHEKEGADPEHDAAEPRHEEHEQHEVEKHEVVKDHLGIRIDEGNEGKEVTSLLIQYRSPIAVVQFPRMVNSNSALQAASPAFETARLFSLIGVGTDILEGFAYLIIFIAGLSIFIALYNSLRERQYDLAIMRSLGASKLKLFNHIVLEGIIITLIGGVLGFLLGHAVVELLGRFLLNSNQTFITGFLFLEQEWLVVVISVFLGILASLLPAVNAYNIDISKVLAKGGM